VNGPESFCSAVAGALASVGASAARSAPAMQSNPKHPNAITVLDMMNLPVVG
jgi:hypothetical protein